MAYKNFIRDYLSFSRKDRLGVLALAGFIFLIYIIPVLFSKKPEPGALNEGSPVAILMDSLSENSDKDPGQDTIQNHKQGFRSAKSTVIGELFNFDPNELDASGWQRLGLSEKTANTIIHYRSKGGRFRQTSDLQKIWGLPDGFYERVKNYVHIKIPEASSPLPSRPARVINKPERLSVSVNEADSADFEALPGIGAKLAARIINFREKLGGFYSIEQIAEVYGLADSVFNSVKPFLVNAGSVKKININTATAEILEAHPYIRWKLAKMIVAYRNQHGDFKSLEELGNVAIMNDSILKKLMPYLEK